MFDIEDLTLDNDLLSNENISLQEEDNGPSFSGEDKSNEEDPIKEEIEEKITTEEEIEDLFIQKENPESRGSKEEKEEDAEPSNSPNFYSKVASALKEESILQSLNEDDLKNIKTPEDFEEAINKEINSRLESSVKRVKEALEYGIEPNIIKQYEGAINYLDSITDETITDESEKGETLRKQLIYQDFVNRGFSKERATKEVEKSFKAGTDIEDAKEAKESNKTYFKQEYDSLIEEGKREVEEDKKKAKETGLKLQKLITDNSEPFSGIKLDSNIKKKIYDNITKPVYTDDDGNQYTAIQKMEKEDKSEFLYKLGLVFTLTDGFKNLDKLIKNQVKSEKRNAIRDLSSTLQNVNLGGGQLSFMSGEEEPDSESYISKNLKLDL